MTHHSDTVPASALKARVMLRDPADLADALPYLLGYHPDDSIVLVGLHGPRGRLGGRIRTQIPHATDSWAEVADQLAACLLDDGRVHGPRPEAALVYLCQDPAPGERAEDVLERLRPLAQGLRTACGERGLPVFEALYVSGGRYWSYCGAGTGAVGGGGAEVPPGGTSVMAAAAAYAGLRVRGSLKDLESRLRPLPGPVADRQLRAFDAAAVTLVPRLLGTPADISTVRAETVRLAERLLSRFRRVTDGGPGAGIAVDTPADRRDDMLVVSEEAARLIIGLQDRTARDLCAEWMEGAEAAAALRLWRALARRCVQAYEEHAAAPLSLAGWVAWSVGDEPGARVALARALSVDADYAFARLLHQACNDGLDPEPLRRCMRQQRAARRP